MSRLFDRVSLSEGIKKEWKSCVGNGAQITGTTGNLFVDSIVLSYE